MLTEPDDGWLTPAQVVITPATCRAARALLAIKQRELADAAMVALSTVIGFETSEKHTLALMRRSMQTVLEGFGIDFIVDESLAIGVRLRVVQAM